MTLQPHGLEHAASTDPFELLLQVSSEGICLLDPDGVCAGISAAGARLLGYEPRELTGRRFHVVVHSTAQRRPARCPLCGPESDDFSATEVLTRKDGSALEATCTGRPFAQEDGTVGRLVVFAPAASSTNGAGTDAEVRLLRTVAELAAEKQRSETVHAFARQLFVTPLEDLDRTIVDDLCALTDSRLGLLYKGDDVEDDLALSASHGVFRSGISERIPREQGSVGEALATRQPVAEDRSSAPVEIAGRAFRHILYVPLWDADEDLGVLILARAVARPYSSHEQEAVASLAALGGVALANTNMVGRLERLSQLTRAALEGIVEGIRLVDSEGRELYSNASMRQLDLELGVSMHGSIYGAEGVEFAEQTTDPEGYLTELLEMQGDRERRSRTEWELEESGRSFERYSAPINDSLGAFIGRVFVLREMTAERHAERLRADLVSFVSHELRTPLTSMLAFANIILEEAKESQNEWILHVETIRGELVRLLGMVEDLLDVERLGAAGMPLRRTPFDLTALVREQVAAQEKTSRRHELVVDAPPDPLVVDADRERVAQVLSNLIANAIKYSPEGGPVQIEVVQGRGAVRVLVSDSGIGIPDDQQDRIFTKFFRAESSDMAGIPGLGLGLALSRDIVSLHGGTMGFDSEPGDGATFWFELPLG